MTKKFLGLLLSFYLMAGLLPVNTMAAAPSASVTLSGKTLTVKAYDTSAYSKNTNIEAKDTSGSKFTAVIQEPGGDSSNWNAKLIWNSGDTVPTLYLKNFLIDEYNEQTKKWKETKTPAIDLPADQPIKIIIISNSQIKTRFGITYRSNLEIKSDGNAKLSIWNRSSAISSGPATGCALTIDANLDLFVSAFHDTNSHILQANKADLTINGGNIKIATDDEKSLAGILTRNSGNIIINGGSLDVASSIGAAPNNGTIQSAGKIVITGGTTKVTAKSATGLYAKSGIKISGGSVDILTPYYGINAGTPEEPTDIVINGGTVKIAAEHAFYTHPILGAGVFAYAGADEASAKTYDGTYTPMAKEPWMLISNDPALERTAPTTAPTVSPTPSPTPADATSKQPPYLDPSLVYWFAATGAIGLIGIVTTLIVYRRKK